jgi:hypothetical protein
LSHRLRPTERNEEARYTRENSWPSGGNGTDLRR